MDALVGEKGLLETVKKRQEFKVLEQSIRQARAENEMLREEAKRLRSDPAAIEDLARRELGLISPGEHLFILKDRHPIAEQEGRYVPQAGLRRGLALCWTWSNGPDHAPVTEYAWRRCRKARFSE